jgi:hypothetical protein
MCLFSLLWQIGGEGMVVEVFRVVDNDTVIHGRPFFEINYSFVVFADHQVYLLPVFYLFLARAQ